MHLILTVCIIFSISLVFSMFGKGGGEFYLPTIISILGIPFYTAAGTSVFLILMQSISMMLVYHLRNKLIDWKLAFSLVATIASMSFLGGFFSYDISAVLLKVLFAVFLLVSAYFMLREKKVVVKKQRFGVWHREFGDTSYDIHLLLVLPPVAAISLVVGMIGISGGGLIVPIIILLGGVPLRVAMGTNTFLIFASSSMSFFGHALRGGVDWKLSMIFGLTVIAGSQVGSRVHTNIKEQHLKLGFVAILVVAALWMIVRLAV